MKRIEFNKSRDQWFLIPTIGIVRITRFKGLRKYKYELNLCFGWLTLRLAVRIYTEKEWRSE